MSKAPQQRSSAKPARTGFTNRDGNGTLFYDAPGVPTLSGSMAWDGTDYAVTGEPAVDGKQQDYVRVTGDGVSGALYKNDRKEQDRHPDYTGPIDVDGRKGLRMSAWIKQTKSGKNVGQDYLSIAISERQQQQTS